MYCITEGFSGFVIQFLFGGNKMFENKEAKNKTIGIRVREEEHQLIKDVAIERGFKNSSEYVLDLIKKDIEKHQ